MLRCLLIVPGVFLALAPFGVGVGVALQFGAGLGLAAGSLVAGLVGAWVLTADLIPTPSKREAVR